MPDWQECVEPSRSYSQDEVASLLGVDAHQVTCTMQVGIIRAEQRNGDKWHATGRDLLEWGKTAMLADEVFALFDMPPTKAAEPAKRRVRPAPTPEPIQETPPPLEPVIYFARCGEYIKIGFTRGKAQQRLKGLATANPSPVELVATTPGGQELERELHERFSAFRRSGEWFVFSDQIREYIASLEG